MTKEIAVNSCSPSIKHKIIKAFDRKPSKGGIPAIEKKMNTKEKDHNLLATNRFENEDKNKEIEFVLKKVFKLF